MTDKVQKIKDWISRTQDGLMDANGNFENPSNEGAFHILSNLDYYIDSLQEEPVSDDLGECINELSKQFPEVSFAKLSRIAVRVVKWKEQQMMAKAVDAVVKIDAGGYPYVDRTIELYDYLQDIPLAKRGDKVKILVIKES